MGLLLILQACRPKAEAMVEVNSDPMAYVPADVSMFMEANLQAMTDKTDMRAILRHETFQTVFADSAGYLKGAMDLLLQSGLDKSRPVIMYQQGEDKSWRFVAGVERPDSLAAQLVRLDMPPATKADGFWYTSANGSTIAWNQSIVCAAQGEFSAADIPTQLLAVAGESATANANLMAFRDKPGDMHLWADAGKLSIPLPWLAGLLENTPGMHTGIRLINEKGRMAMQVDVDGMSPEQQGRMDRWFAAANGSKGWERLPAGTPAWMSMALPADPTDLGWTGEEFFTALCGSGTEAVLAFHQIKLPQFYPRISLIVPRRAGSDTKALEAAMKASGVYNGPGQMSIMGMKARYGTNNEYITASTTDDPASLFKAPAQPMILPDAYAAAFTASPIRAYVDAAGIASVLPLPMVVSDLKDLAIYAERLSGPNMALHLEIRTSNPEVYGLGTAINVILELIPAVQMMNSFI